MAATDEYRSYAQECLRWAEETNNEENRQALLAMARMWSRLAEQGHHAQAPKIRGEPRNA
jgi:hypothetical protein